MSGEIVRYAVLIDDFDHDGNGNPIARHTVFGYASLTQPLDQPTSELFTTSRRQQTGFEEKRSKWVRTAIEKAGGPVGMPEPRIIGNRSNGAMYAVFGTTPENAMAPIIETNDQPAAQEVAPTAARRRNKP